MHRWMKRFTAKVYVYFYLWKKCVKFIIVSAFVKVDVAIESDQTVTLIPIGIFKDFPEQFHETIKLIDNNVYHMLKTFHQNENEYK